MKRETMTAAAFRKAAPKAKPTKYRAVPTVVDGIRFDSKAEGRRYKELRVIEAAGEITNLRLQPRYELQCAFRDVSGRLHRAITYVGDFEYVKSTGLVVCEDVKGIETPAFKLKRKLFLAKYPNISLEIVR